MVRRILIVLAEATILFGAYAILQPYVQHPQANRLGMRASVPAVPAAFPPIVEVTRVVLSPTPSPTPTPAPTQTPEPADTPEPAFTASPVPTATAAPAPAEPPATEPVAQAASLAADTGPQQPVVTAIAVAGSEVAVAGAIAVDADTSGCPTSSDRSYALVPVTGPALEHPDHLHGDLNLSLRGYEPAGIAAALLEIGGPTDGDPPQLAAVLPQSPSPQLAGAYRVNEWDWGCGEHGCRSGQAAGREVSLLGLRTSPGAPVSVPSRHAHVYGGGYVALVLFADETRLTVVYTREDSVANGYSVHLENLCVDSALLSTYRSANAAGRGSLPAVRNGDIVGVAAGDEIAVAVRDRGSFGDPRSRKDWWR